MDTLMHKGQGTRCSTTPISSPLSKGRSGKIHKCLNHVLNGLEATPEGRSLTPPTPAPLCSSLNPTSTHNNTPTDHWKSTTYPTEKKHTLPHQITHSAFANTRTPPLQPHLLSPHMPARVHPHNHPPFASL